MGDFVEIVEREIPDTGIKQVVATPNLGKAADRDKLHLIKELRVGKDGELTLKLRDQDHALDQLARSAGAFEKDHTINLPPQLLHLLNMTPDERASREAAYDHMENWDGDSDGTREEAGRADPAP